MASLGQNRIRVFGICQLTTATVLTLALVAALIVVAPQAVQAQTFTVIHPFSDGGDGATPDAGLTMDAAGNLYGTAASGGNRGGNCAVNGGCGTVFKLSYRGSAWTLSPLYSFQGSNDGATPLARVIRGPEGILYGTTHQGGGSGCGGSGCGTVFKLTPQLTVCKTALCPWTETVLYRFTGGTDGANPGNGDIVFDQAGNLYGTTTSGGVGRCNGGRTCGIVYKLTPSNGSWTESVLYSFTGGSDGGNPSAGVIFDRVGNLYGTTAAGGNLSCSAPYGCGTIFQLAPSGSGWAENILYTFENGSDGANPYGGLVFDPAGNLYGTTPSGGTAGGGTVFMLAPSNGGWIFDVVYSFSGSGESSGPFDTLIMDATGNLYGTTYLDGAYGFGNVFELSPSGGGWTGTSLHDFTGGSDGADPVGNVVMNASGNLFSTTFSGGADGQGVVFQITPSTWGIGLDFRNSSNFVTDPPGDTYVLPNSGYPTTFNGTNFGWTNVALIQGRDRSTSVDPRLAGINYVMNGTPATFYVDLPASGTFNLSLAMGDEGYPECSTQCEIQFLDGSTVLATVTGGPTGLGYFYDAQGNNWSAAAWPASNVSRQVAVSGSRLTVVVGTSDDTGDLTPIAFLGIAQVTLSPNFLLSALPSSLSVAQGNQGTSAITTNISGGFNSAVNLSASGMPAGTTVSFNPSTIPAPGAGASTMTITVGSNTPVGSYPITVTGNGGGVQQTTTVTLIVTAAVQPSFILTVSPPAVSVAQGTIGNTTATTTLLGGFSGAISLTAAGMPAGTTVSFNPQTIPAPGAGSSTMTITVGANTPPGTYPITVTGTGGGVQQNATVQLMVISSVWQQGFDFRGSSNFVTDPPGDTDVVLTTVFPTTGTLTTYGWSYTATFSALDRDNLIDPRLAGINYVTDGYPADFYVNLPAPGTYNLSLAMGDAGYPPCFTLCEIQFFDGNSLLATVTGGPTNQGYFYDAQGNVWSAAQWPASNVSRQVTLAGTQLTVQVGSTQYNGNTTPIAYLGVTQVSTGPTFAVQAPTAVSVGQGQYSTADLFTVLIGGFNSAVNLSAAGAPQGVTVTFNPSTIPAPGAGTSIMTINAPSSTPLGSYPLTVTGSGGGIVQNTTVVLTVTVADPPAFSLTVPGAVSTGSGGQATGTIAITVADGFNSAVTLSAAGAPNGTTVSFNPTTIPAPGSGSSTMSVTVPGGTAFGSYPITVTAASGQGNQTATVTLTVSASGQVNLPAGTGWEPLNNEANFCNVSPGYTYYNPDVGAVDAFDFLSSCIGGQLVAYGGGAADTSNDRYFLWTSGHNNYQGNEMYVMNLQGASPTAVRITDPDWTVDNTQVPPDCACKGTNNCGQGLWHNGAGQLVSTPFSESGYDGPAFESTPAPDGSFGQPSCGYGSRFTPNAREIYAGMVYNTPTNKLFAWGGAAAADPTGPMFSNWKLDLNQHPPKWTRLQDSSYQWFTAAVYDYTTGHPTSGYDLVFDENHTLYQYNPATDAYTVLASNLPYIGYNADLDLDPVHHYLVMENGDTYGGYHLRIVNIDSCNGTNCTVTNLDGTASCAGALGYWAGITWDSKRNVMAIFPSSTNCSGAGCTPPFNTVYLLNPDPINTVTITYQGQHQTIPPQQCFAASYGPTPPLSFGPGVYSRFKYYPNEDVYLYIPNPTNPWILRLEQ